MIGIQFDWCRTINTGDDGYNGCIEAYDEENYVYFYRWEKDVCEPPFHINYGFVRKDGLIESGVPIFNLNEGREEFHPNHESTVDEYDPRIIRWGNNDEYVLFSVYYKRLRSRFVTIKDREIYLTKPTNLIAKNFDFMEYEKNWMPFVYEDFLYMVYTIEPHVIIRFHRTGLCEKIHETNTLLNWKWGWPSGGTQAVKINDTEYLTFFHSYLTSSRESNRIPRNYYAGAYVFESKPPFKILRATPEPLFWDGLHQTESKSPHVVVFPSGLVCENGKLTMTYGENDRATFMAQLPVERILNKMIRV